jgi:enoyl-CoA hydratase
MCVLMGEALRLWEADAEVHAVLIEHSGPRGFCAGGDIRMLAESGRSDGAQARAFFAAEYRLNTAIHRFPKPYIAVMDGVAMGGGVGVSVHGALRIVTERTTFAMPETGIGLFPDVGGGWFLPRLPGRIGLWLALTGARLKAADCLAAGVGTHFIPAAQVEAFKTELAAQGSDLGQLEAVNALAQRYGGDAGPAPLADKREAIDRLFAGESLEAIFAALEADEGEFAQETLAALRTKSPQSLRLTLRQMQHGAAMQQFEEVMAMEHRLATRVVATADFQEGVRAVILDKDGAPRWTAASLAAFPPEAAEPFFAPLAPEAELRFTA